jgi:hypothetical protein
MTPSKLTLLPFTEGDEWEGIPSINITVGPAGGPFAAPVAPLALVTCRFKRSGDVPSDVVELTSATPGQINITNAATWTFSIPAQIVPKLTKGKWTFRIKCKDNTSTGKPKTYLGDEITVLETV